MLVTKSVGNILELQHQAASGSWTRRYQYATNGNRLLATSGPGDGTGVYSHEYEYNPHGSMTAMPHLAEIAWDHADRMQSADLGGGGTVWFLYDSAGNRVRKIRVNLAGTTTYERVYLGGYEVYRERVSGDLELERQTLHVADDTGRICLVETKTVEDGNPVTTAANISRYQYGNHLGSVGMELSETGDLISYEEFHPYGTSAYRAANSAVDVSPSRYRYTGKERDEETGLGHHGARYYASWLGRWTAADPIGLGDGVNRFAYARSNPIAQHDPSGTRSIPHSGAQQELVQYHREQAGEAASRGAAATSAAFNADYTPTARELELLGGSRPATGATLNDWDLRLAKLKTAEARFHYAQADLHLQLAHDYDTDAFYAKLVAEAARDAGDFLLNVLSPYAEAKDFLRESQRLNDRVLAGEATSEDLEAWAESSGRLMIAAGPVKVVDKASDLRKAKKGLDKVERELVEEGRAPAKKGIARAADINWKGFSDGKEKVHFIKHGAEFGEITQAQYKGLAKGFASEAGEFQEQAVGNFIVKFDPTTRRTLVGHVKDREIRTFYRADARDKDPFTAAIELARKLGGGG